MLIFAVLRGWNLAPGSGFLPNMPVGHEHRLRHDVRWSLSGNRRQDIRGVRSSLRLLERFGRRDERNLRSEIDSRTELFPEDASSIVRHLLGFGTPGKTPGAARARAVKCTISLLQAIGAGFIDNDVISTDVSIIAP